MAASRDPERTRARILRASVAEFAAKGFAGARVDAIARRARINKRMLYHYFGGKRALFRAAVSARLATRHPSFLGAPQTIAERLPFHFALYRDDDEWVRLLLWEALTYRDKPVIAEDERRAAALEALTRLRDLGNLAPNLDPGMGQLALIALALFPFAFPQVTRFVTGSNAHSPAFLREYTKLLERIGEHLGTSPPSGDPSPRRSRVRARGARLSSS